MKFNVYGTVYVAVTVTVEADNADDAIDKAYDECSGLSGYVGNGGSDKLVGTNNSSVSLDAGESEAYFTDAEPLQ